MNRQLISELEKIDELLELLHNHFMMTTNVDFKSAELTLKIKTGDGSEKECEYPININKRLYRKYIKCEIAQMKEDRSMVIRQLNEIKGGINYE